MSYVSFFFVCVCVCCLCEHNISVGWFLKVVGEESVVVFRFV